MRYMLIWAMLGLLLNGCYLTHGLDDFRATTDGASVPNDDATVSPNDGALPQPGMDSAVPEDDAAMDGGLDAGPDAMFDAGEDSAIIVGVDAEPALTGPPNAATCRIEPTIFPFSDPVLEFRWPAPGEVPLHAGSTHVCSTPLVVDVDPTDGDINPWIIFPSYDQLRDENGVLRMVNPRTGDTISYPPTAGERGPLEPSTNLAAGDIDGDGFVEIVGLGVASGSYAFNHDGTLLWESPFPTARDRGLRFERTIGGAVSLADLDNDGSIEIIAGRNVLNGIDGTRRFTGDSSVSTRATNEFLGPVSCVFDLDGDDDLEVIAGRTAFHDDGTVFWNNTELPDGLCGVADLYDTIPGPEVVHISLGYLYVLNGQTGDIIYDRVIEGRVGRAIGGAPTIADFDGDGRPEIGVAHGGAYGVYDLDCERTGVPAGCVAEGLRWIADTADDSSSGTGSSVFDFNGDGRAEVVYNDQYYFRVYDGVNGTALFEHRNSSRTRTENPVIADVDDDGDAEIVFSANAEAWLFRDSWTDPGIEIWGDSRGRWVGARRIWNQHTYHITNVEEDGTIPRIQRDTASVLNAYRQNLREGGDVLVVPDLWGGRGAYECLGGNRIRITINVQNWGLERVGAGVVISFWRGRPSAGGIRVGETTTSRVLLPEGDSETITFETTLSGEVIDYYAVLDDPEEPVEGNVFECREGNNEVLIWRPECS